MPIIVQPASRERILSDGFTDVSAVETELEWEGIAVARTGGRHGHGAVADALGPVSGFVLRAAGEPTLYLAGDTVWADQVDAAIARHRPDIAVVNAGAARFLDSDPITMDADDVARVTERVPRVVAVHLEAVNHCLLTRAELHAAVPSALVPADGEALEL